MSVQPKAPPMGITPPPRWTPPITPTPEPTLTPTEWPPLDFWNYPDYYDDHRDNLRTKGSEPFWMRDAKKPTKVVEAGYVPGSVFDYMLTDEEWERKNRRTTRIVQDDLHRYNCPTCGMLGVHIPRAKWDFAFRCRVGHSWDTRNGRALETTPALKVIGAATWRHMTNKQEYPE